MYTLNYTSPGGTLGGSGPFFIPENSSAPTGFPLNPSPEPSTRDPALARVEMGVLGLILALTTLGNGFVLWVLLRRRKNLAPMHLFMVNLCVADLVVAFFQVLPQLLWDITERFQGPDALCRLVKYLQIVGMFASSYMIVAMTVDRHHAICCPLQAYRGGTASRWNSPLVVAWGLAMVLSLPQAFIFSRSEVSPGVFECWGHFVEPWGLKAYVTWMTVAVFVLPALIIIFCQVRIFREIRNNIYLSERVVTVEYKRTSVLFHFHGSQQEGQSGRGSGGGGGREEQGCHSLPLDDNTTSLIPPHSPAPPTEQNMHENRMADPQSNLPTRNDNPPVALSASSAVHTSGSILSCETETLSLPPDCPTGLDPLCLPPPAPDSKLPQPSPFSSTSYSSYDYPPDSYPDAAAHCGASMEHPPQANLHSLPPPSLSKAMSKTVRMTLVIVLVYTLCWSPFFIVQLWAAWDPNPPLQG
ncbi:hypothetical protein SKAU_G00277090 [Synaphobranchus kaupii]|uniref:G-protein coupled receptors family 1 profile domain-containing protein n=1 Tax=Synaphobranchus kaupii TaxID=118154 RepID=A0A9Q1F1G1_SYNKA|nr:hypothetical protein SKAU_G00277090 [Synaphobranchus kaupii]